MGGLDLAEDHLFVLHATSLRFFALKQKQIISFYSKFFWITFLFVNLVKLHFLKQEINVKRTFFSDDYNA